MPISQSLYTAVTGLNVNSDGMAVIANNIANANAKGFKRDRAEFEDMLSSDLSTGGGAGQIGRGARIRDVRTIHSQGGMAVTDNLTDLAIQGQGFFVLSNPFTEVQESAGKFFTRVGSFVFDRDGFLADTSGGRVQGYMMNAKSGSLSTKLEDFKVYTNAIPPQGTSVVRLDLNLDARSKIIEGEFDINNADKTSNFANGMTIFDSQGRSHQMTVYFKRTEGNTEGSAWNWHALVDGKEISDADGEFKQIAKGFVKFDNNGILTEQETTESEANFAGGAKPGQAMNFDFGKIKDDSGSKVAATTCIAAKSVTNYHQQDGYESGNIKTIRIELDGSVRGLYTNGIQKHLGSLALATFENQDGLLKGGRNLFYSTITSGPAKIGVAQSGTRGSIYASTLEESNVDLAGEFVNMIMTQRAFQANSRSITTADTMIEEVINLKR